MTEIIFSFDTEDFTSSYAADAIRDNALLLESEGIRGCFCLVGLLARQLVAWKRFDVLEALRAHEVDSHTFGHTLHPCIVEYADVADYEEAYRHTLASEAEGLGMIRAATGTDRVYATVPPGPSVSYAMMYACRRLDIPFYADSPIKTGDGGDIYFCNMLQSEYYRALEWTLLNDDYDVNDFVEELTSRKRAVIYNHPNMVKYVDFWDKFNYYKENINPFGQWEEPPRRPLPDTIRFYHRFRELVQTLKADGRFKFLTYGDIIKERQKLPPRIVTLDMLREIRDALRSDFAEIDAPVKLSLSDAFAACVEMLRGAQSHVCGDVYGFLSEPKGVSLPVSVSADDVIETAKTLDTSTFLPPVIDCGGFKLGPADYLFAALDVLCGEKEIVINPKPQQYPLDRFPNLRDFSLCGEWEYSDSFKDEFMSDRLRLQAWTIRKGEL